MIAHYERKSAKVFRLSDLDLKLRYSYTDYLSWELEERLELIKGQVVKMPAPLRLHQKISMILSRELSLYLKDRSYEVYSAPFDVRLPTHSKQDDAITTVVQPDLCVVCDPEKLDRRGCIGAPDIVIEILSPGNNKKELQNKYEVYQESGVKEYWIISPADRILFRYTLNSAGNYEPSRLLTLGDAVSTPILPGFVLDLDEVFGEL